MPNDEDTPISNDAMRGKIRYRAAAQRVRDFSGLCWGKITPTDIDGFLDFRGKTFVLFELKQLGVQMPAGQKLAFERLCDSCTAGGTETMGLLAWHESGTGDIDGAGAMVELYYWRGQWRSPKRPISLKQAIDRFLEHKGLA